MERKEAIERLKQLRLDYTEFWEEIKNETTEALDIAIASLETDEAYNLMYEQPEFCEDCISRSDIIDRCKYVIEHGKPSNGKHSVSVEALLAVVQIMPSVMPIRPKGHWIVQPSNKEQGERDFIWWKCSECGQVIFSETEHDRLEFHSFCGRCGADMRGEEK